MTLAIGSGEAAIDSDIVSAPPPAPPANATMPHPFDDLGSALRWLRWRRQRTQREVAESAGITRAMLSAYESGRQLPTLATLGRLLVTLGVDLAELGQALALHQGRALAGEAEERGEDDAGLLPS